MDMGIPEMIVWYVAFVFSATLHECAHALVAQKGGDLTAYLGGQVSLNPLPHIRREPIGMVVLPVISLFLIHWPFGYASAPYNPLWAMRYPRRAARMAMAGPAANLLLVLASAILIQAGLRLGVFAVPARPWFSTVALSDGGAFATGLAYVLSIFFSMNLLLAVLNLIPLPPLDGSQIILFFLSEETANRYQAVVSNPMFGLIGLLVAWRVFSPIFAVVFTAVTKLLYLGHV